MQRLDALSEHYNARGLTPEMVAQSFVTSRQFVDVARDRNAVLLGPRGSGKTTLLRMLDPRALGTWNDPDGEVLRNSVAYIGVFVPVDKAWISSLDNVLIPLAPDERGSAELAVYSLAMARAIVDAMVWRTADTKDKESRFRARLPKNDESLLAQNLAALWLPDRSPVSLLQVRLLLTQELALLPRIFLEHNSTERTHRLSALSSPVKLAAAACEMFNLLAHDEGRRWAILCDELEIAPPSVQRHLFASLRATPNPLILKIALTPAIRLPGLTGVEHPVAAHDYDSISLSYATRQEGVGTRDRESFCRGIWRGLAATTTPQYPNIDNPDFSFATPPIGVIPPSPLSGKKVSTDARLGPSFRRLAALDESFSSYLLSKGVDVANLDSRPDLLSSVIRKVRPLVGVRSYYLKKGASHIERASRRGALPYCGARNIFAVSESHPRWLKTTLGSMINDAGEKPPYISLVSQTREIRIAVSRIVARLKSFPAINGQSTFGLVEKVGHYFAAQIYAKTFKPDPVLSFVVDEKIGEDMQRCLENALYIGALVPLDLEEHVYLLNGIGGARFRLSNWLAPHFRLPLVAGKSVPLSTLLAKTSQAGLPAPTLQMPLGLEK